MGAKEVNILIYDVAASSSGALSVLQEFHRTYSASADNNKYFFVISTPELAETDNIKVLRYPWIKKSWFHRLFFEYIYTLKIIDNYNISEILSLQNITIPNTKLPQTLYLHQPLPFVEHRFSFFSNKKFWVYQNIIAIMIKHSVKKANKVIVQTNWMKKACVAKCGIDSKKVEVQIPPIDTSNIKNYLGTAKSRKTFFYPATSLNYKNHITLFEACKILIDQGINDFNIILTIKGNENKLAESLYSFAKQNKLPIEFRGAIPRKEVFYIYSKSVLVFPSYIETFGLPLLEARLSNTPIIVADTEFAREILNNYKYVSFCNIFDACEFAKNLIKHIST